MTAIELSHFYLETGGALGEVITELEELHRIRPNWLHDAADAFKNDNPLGDFLLHEKRIYNMQEKHLLGDFLSVLEGLRQLDLLFYRKKHYFDKSRSEEEHLCVTIRHALEVYYHHANNYLEDRLALKSEDEQFLFFKKIRYWSLLKSAGANASNEISTLICKESAATPRPILLDICLALECTEQAAYQSTRCTNMSDEQAAALCDFAKKTSEANLDYWNL